MFGTYLDAHDIRSLIKAMPVCPFPPMRDRAAWEKVEGGDREDLLALYGRLKDTPYPMLTATQFMAFVKTGSRKAYEDPYFLRRKKLIAAVMHMCLTGTDEALADVIDGVWTICEESSWVISAHNVNPFPGTVKPSQKPLPDVDDRYVDLFSAQTAMVLAYTCHLVGDALDAEAPVIKRRILSEIEKRVLTPFMTRDDFWWMGFIRRDLCNWTPWIISNILITASLVWHDPLRFAAMCDRACRMLDRWLAILPQDGGCDEGTAYYNMAGGSLMDCLELLESATDGQMTFWHVDKIRSILDFPLKTQLKNGWFVNFADCDAKPFLCGERLQTAGEKLGDSALAAMGVSLRGTPSQQIGDIPHFSRLLMRLFHPAAKAVPQQKAERDVWLPDLQLRVCERGGMILCAKGGHNAESHNHNDVGSFMLYVDGEPEIVDAGNMTYTAKTFAGERYTLFNTRSAYHNLPVIGGYEQQPGEAFRAKHVRRLEGGLALDIADAYPDGAALVRCERSMSLQDGALVVHDVIALQDERETAWVFMLRHQPETGHGFVKAGTVEILHDANLAARVEEIPVSDARMAKSFPGSLWRLILAAGAETAHDVTFTIRRADG
ncbi:MAG: heparinase II/III family protein [Clostridia bacterium]|nr:heparinase II/III family protein [Clostridia bacterium]